MRLLGVGVCFEPLHTEAEIATEQWQDIPGFPYQASSLGRIRRSVKDPCATAGKHTSMHINPVTGYVQVRLHVNNVAHNGYVHRRVAAAFLGPCPHGMEVHHKDENKSNNRIENLCYVTRSVNLMASGRCGATHHCAVISDATAVEIRSLWKPRVITKKNLAKQFGVSRWTIDRVVRRCGRFANI